MSQFPTNKTVPQDKDIAVHDPKVTGATGEREQLSVVLDNFDQAIQQEISDRTADVTAEETRALAAEADLQAQLTQEISNRIADVDAEEAARIADVDAEELARTQADQRIANAIANDNAPLTITVSGAKTISIGPAFATRIDPLTNSTLKNLIVPNESLVSDFTGGTINFSTGVVTGGTNFTPISFSGHAGEWAKYVVILLPGEPNQLLVLPAEGYGSSALTAPNPAFDGGIPVGVIAVQDNGTGGTGTIQDLAVTNIYQFLSSGTGNGSGSGSPLDINLNENFIYYTRSDFAVDKKTFIDSTTGSDQVLGLKKVTLNVGQNLITKDLTGPQSYKDALQINKVSARLLYTVGKTDENATVQFSTDGGLSFQSATVSLFGSSSANYVGNTVLAERSFPQSSSPLQNSGASNGTRSVGQKIAALFAPPYRTLFNSFSFSVRTFSTAGSVTAKIYSVYAGIPQTLIATSKDVYYVGTDVTSTSKDLSFSFDPMVMDPSLQYALAIEGTSLNNNLEVDNTSVSNVWNVWSSKDTGSGWTASSNLISYKLYGSGFDLRMKVVSGTAGSELLGFGVNYVEDLPYDFDGINAFEDRYITAAEASTGLIKLNYIKYTVGTRQLQCFYQGHVFVSPDFTEIDGTYVQFPAGSFVAGDYVRFQNCFGTYDSTSQAMNKIGGLNPIVVGSTAQVAAGIATHASLTSALSAVSGQKVTVLAGTYTENVTISSNCMIEGQGYGTVINGNFTLSTNYSTIRNLKFGGNVTVTGSGNFIKECFASSTSTISDSGVANKKEIIQE